MYFQKIPARLHKTNSVKYRLYSPTFMTNAYMAVKNHNMSVRKAARQISVPKQTLRDSTIGKIDADCVTKVPVLSMEEKAKLVDHLTIMAFYGYRYTRQEVADIASDYAFPLQKKTKDSPFTIRWFRGFIKRWPELRVLKSQGLEITRAKCVSVANIDKYFKELDNVLTKYGLKDKPRLIFNVDEKGIIPDHSPPYVVADSSAKPPAVITGKSQTITLLGCSSASGYAIPPYFAFPAPYFVFPGKWFSEQLLQGATPGAAGCVSESGWSNSEFFKSYLKDHFIKYVPGRTDDHVLLLFDDQSHTFLLI